jgi:putative membrane protein
VSIFAKIIVALVAILHLYIAWFGIFAWQAQGPGAFPEFPADLFEPTTAMAANQGVYNLCLAAGLIWSLFIRDAEWQRKVAIGLLLLWLPVGWMRRG